MFSKQGKLILMVDIGYHFTDEVYNRHMVPYDQPEASLVSFQIPLTECHANI